MKLRFLLPSILACCALLTSVALAEDKADSKTVTVKSEPLKIEVKLSGVFEARKMTKVSIDPKAWTTWTVVEAAPAGTKVNKGAKLIEFDSEKLDKSIAELEDAQAASDLALEQADKALRLLKKTVPLALAAAERNAKQSQENLEHYRNIDKPNAIHDAHYSVEQSQNYLDYENEELKQLEQMYAEDDLTEQTEEIIIMRLQHRIKSATLRHQRTKEARTQALKYNIPRRTAATIAAAKSAKLALKKAQDTLPASIEVEEIALEKLRKARTKQREKLDNLRRDRSFLTVLAPAKGVVYYGKCAGGNWPEAAAMTKLLRKGGAIKAKQVFMTIIDTNKLMLRATVEEKQLHLLRGDGDVQGTVTPTAFPSHDLPVSLSKLANLPISAGKYAAEIDLKGGQKSRDIMIMPGMTGSVTFTVYNKENALLVPKSAVQRRGNGKRYVVVQDGDKTREQNVRTGKISGDRIEILKGLKVGDVVVK